MLSIVRSFVRSLDALCRTVLIIPNAVIYRYVFDQHQPQQRRNGLRGLFVDWRAYWVVSARVPFFSRLRDNGRSRFGWGFRFFASVREDTPRTHYQY